MKTHSTQIRLAGGGDRQAVLGLLTAQLSEHSVQPEADGLAWAVDRLLQAPEFGRILVADRGGEVVGVAAVSFGWSIELGGPGAWLEELYVDPAHRGGGIGADLVRAAGREARSAGMKALDLQVEAGHERAANLYRREGFDPFERQQWRLTLEPLAAAAPAASPRAGGCLCGAVRYRLDAVASHVNHCHCTLCRRSTGAPFVTWVTVPASAFAFTRGAPAERPSSPQAVRTFCAECGTALTFRFVSQPEVVDVTAGSLDDPDAVAPADHLFTDSMLKWLRLDDGLPRYRGKRG